MRITVNELITNLKRMAKETDEECTSIYAIFPLETAYHKLMNNGYFKSYKIILRHGDNEALFDEVTSIDRLSYVYGDMVLADVEPKNLKLLDDSLSLRLYFEM